MYFCIYETKGLSLEQVDELYGKVNRAWHSKGFVPTVNFHDIEETMAEGIDGKKTSLADLEQVTGRKKSIVGEHEENVAEEK